MRTVTMALSFISLSVMTVHAQDGVYLSLKDFENNKLTYATNAGSGENKIRFNEILYKPYLIVKHNGEKIHVFKDEIYAYKKKGTIVRAYNFTPYYLLEQGHVWLYYKDVYASQPKGTQRVRKYFYSTSGNGNIQPLTVHNLKKSFPENDLFHVYLDAQFRSDADLAMYDPFANKYKVNHFLEKTNSATAISKR
jgi:hypothetical protein